jgi:hypothetical protein
MKQRTVAGGAMKISMLAQRQLNRQLDGKDRAKMGGIPLQETSNSKDLKVPSLFKSRYAPNKE